MKTTRFASVIAAGAMLAAVALPAAAQSPSAAPLTAPGKTVTLMVGVKGDPFYVSMQCGAQDAAKITGVTLDVQGPDKFDATLQNPMLDAVAASKPDALLVAPNDRTASAGPLKNIQDAGTKIVLVDTIVDDPSIGVSRIATNNELGGETAAQALSELGLASGAKVLAISTDPGVSSVDARIEGFNKKAAELGYVLVSDTQYSHNSAETAAQVISAALAADPDLAGVFAANLFTAQGVATGAKQAGATDLKIVGFDAGPDQVKQLEAGDVQALVAQQPYTIGYEGVMQAVAALNGAATTAEIQTPSSVVTAANISDPEVAKYLYKSDCGS
ncbi:MAG: ABC transporter substrate-binding protein [Chloroflexota bacterium]